MGREPTGGFAGDWDRLSLAFETVIAMPPARRAEFMASTYGSDPVLSAELESLVSAHEGANAFLEALHGDVVAPALAHLDEQAVDDAQRQATPSTPGIAPGDQIRHFVVHERLGTGGTGMVYRGRDMVLQRDVAIKVLDPAVSADPVARSRLVREAQAASRLDDPHVCPVYAVEPTADGGLCIVMAYCAGGTLRDRLRRGPITPEAVERIAVQMARGLASAHRAGIVHGDIKPANVGFGDGDSARLLDFGMAVHVADVSAAGRGALAGTVPYLAPELWQGAAYGPATDVWALGVTFFEMVTGRRPFAAPEAGDVAALRERIASAPLPPLTHADGSAPSPELARLIRAMLNRDPANRPADGDAVLSALEGGAPSARAWPRPDRSTVMIVAALALGAIAWIAAPGRAPATTSAVEVARTNAPLPTIAVLPFTTRGDRDIEYLREGMVDMLTPAFDATGLLRGIDPNSVLGAAAQIGTRGLDSAAAQALAVRVGASRYVSGNVLVSGADISIRATLRSSDGREVGRAQTTVRDTAGLTRGVDDVVRQLLASTLLTPGDTVAGIAAATTTSVRALRAYLDGERDLRDARPAAAMANFQRAVTIDSAFALAWYRLARAARWSEVDSVSDRAGQRAYALAATLPPRQQALIRAYHDLRVGSAIAAERQLSQIVRDYPSDVEAWMLLGEVRFSSNPYVGRPLSESGEAFQQVMALDPRNREVTVYLMDLAAGADRRGQLDTLFSMYFSPNSAGEQPGIRSAYIALHRRRVLAAKTGDVLNDPEAARVTLQRITGDVRDRRAARAAADVLAAAAETRADGMRALALLDVAAGDWTAAAARLRIVEATDAQRGLEDRALFALAPGVTVGPDTIRVIRDELRQRRWLRASIDDGLTDVERDGLRQYLVGLLSVRLGDAAGVDAAVRALADARRGASRVAAPLAAAVRGHWAASRGDHAGAVTAFEQSITDVPTRLRARHSVLGQHLDRLVRARALQAMGDTIASGRWYRSLREGAGVTGIPFSAAADSALRVPARR